MDSFVSHSGRVRELSREALEAFQSAEYFSHVPTSGIQIPSVRQQINTEPGRYSKAAPKVTDFATVKRARRDPQSASDLPAPHMSNIANKPDSNSPVLAAEYVKSLLLDLDREGAENPVQYRGACAFPGQYQNQLLYQNPFNWPGYLPPYQAAYMSAYTQFTVPAPHPVFLGQWQQQQQPIPPFPRIDLTKIPAVAVSIPVSSKERCVGHFPMLYATFYT